MRHHAGQVGRLLLALTLILLAWPAWSPAPAIADVPTTPSGIPLGELDHHIAEFAQGLIGHVMVLPAR